MTTDSVGQLSEAARRLLARRLSGQGATSGGAELGRGGREWPLSSDQRRLWFMYELNRMGVEYNVDATFRVRGPLHAKALVEAMRCILGRHEILRTRVQVTMGEPHQVVGDVPRDVVREHDLSAETDPVASAVRLARSEANSAFDLTRGPLFRAWLARLGSDDHAFGIVVHHIAFDRESLDILLRELSSGSQALAGGRAAELPALPASYGDFASWQLLRASAPARETDRAYWRQRLRNIPVMLELPADRPRPARPSHVAGEAPVRVPAGAAESLRTIARRHRTTIFVAGLAAFQGLLSRYAPGAGAVVVGCPFNARTRVEFEGLIGFFARSLPLVADLSGRPDPTFTTLVTMARDAMLEAHTHQELPFDEIVAIAGPPRDLGHNPVFQVWFDLTTGATNYSTSLSGLDVAPLRTDQARTRFDMEMHLADTGTGEISGRLLYAADLFDRETAQDFVGHFERFLSHAACAPDTRLSQIRILTDAERDTIINGWGAARQGTRS